MATNIPPVADNEIITTAWGNQVRTEVSNLDANKFAKVGGAITGNVSVSGTSVLTGQVTAQAAVVLNAQPTVASHATRKDYVDAAAASKLPLAGGRITGDLFVGPGDAYDSVGIELNNNGAMLSHNATGGNANMALSRSTAAAIAAGQAFLYFRRSGSPIGSVMINSSANGVVYNTTSDGRLKDDLGPIIDPLGVIERLRPKHLRWIDGGDEFDGFIAQEVAKVIPDAVYGDPNADPHVEPLQLDQTSFIAYLVGAVQQLSARVAELEDR